MSYDFLLTVADETTLIWSRKRTVAFSIFVAMRYLPLVHQVLMLIVDFLPLTDLLSAADARSAYVPK